MDEGTPNLLVIDEAFGPSADLYVDVLGVQPNASNGQIQHSYFDRREELFRLLNDIDLDQEQDSITASHRLHAERKLDAVVVAMRILGDPELRVEYDDMRFERLQASARKSQALQATPRKKTNPNRRSQELRAEENVPATTALEDTFSRQQRHSPPRTRPRSGNTGRHNKENKDADDAHARLNFSMDSTPSDEGKFGGGGANMEDGTPIRNKVKNKVKGTMSSKSRVVSPDQAEAHRQQKSRQAQIAKERERERERERQGTLATVATQTKFVHQITNEINGTFEDTQSAFEQVFSVFTLRDEDIMAVTGKIDKAKRQIERNMTSPNPTNH